MDDLRDVFRTLDRLNDEELDQVKAYIDQRRAQPQIADEDVQAKIAALHAALENFWDGVPPAEIDEIVKAMNAEYIEPIEPSEYDWLDEDET